MDQIDVTLMNLIQKNFPIHPRPYGVLAEKLQLTEQEVLERIQKMKTEGSIKRIAATFNSKKLGFKSTLCALTVAPDRLEEVSEIINSYKGVTHNYIRNHRYNVWFTLTAPSVPMLEETLREIRERTGIAEILNLMAEKEFKISVNFRL